MNSDEQLELWLKGTPVHRGDSETGECCPDFSCCKPELLADESIRKAFVLANEEDRFRFLGMFLGAAMELAGNRNVHIVAGDRGEES